MTTYNDTYGIVTTDDYPDFYTNNTNSNWLINTGGVITLQFTDFDLQDSPSCSSDFLQVNNRQNANLRLISSYSVS